MKIISKLVFSINISIFIAIIFLLIYFSIPLLREGVNPFGNWDIKKGEYGLLPMIISTLLMATLATILAFIYSLAIALYFNLKRSLLIERLLLIFAFIPTIVYSLIGVVVVAPFIANFGDFNIFNIFSASLILSFLLTPTITTFLIESFKGVKKEYLLQTLALGGDEIDYQLKVMLPLAKRDIFAALILGLARGVGDTMVALTLAGNSISIPKSIFDSGRSLTSHIPLQFAIDFDSIEFKSIYLSALVLLAISLI
ncbi:MAG: ABC transporter permease subunit, partial [Epsilonproteobacteria bacterium]|nr:ABC transporter permease subunit [Campylobacterota bacterium]